jgi:hypothetical protein
LNGNTQARIADVIAAARHVYGNNEAMVRLTVSQAVLESGSHLNSGLARKNNFFGIKGKGTAGIKQFETNEDYGAGLVKINAGFAVNATPEDSFLQHKALLEKPRYASVQNAAKEGNFEQVAHNIQAAGYATDPAYAQKLIDINNRIVGPLMAQVDTGVQYSANQNLAPSAPSGRNNYNLVKKVHTKVAVVTPRKPGFIEAALDKGGTAAVNMGARTGLVNDQVALKDKPALGSTKPKEDLVADNSQTKSGTRTDQGTPAGGLQAKKTPAAMPIIPGMSGPTAPV